MDERLRLEYVLPLKAEGSAHVDDLSAYLSNILRTVDITVVDSSNEAAFGALDGVLPPGVRHLRAELDGIPGHNGKVINVMIGVRSSRHEKIIVADDDVRFDISGLQRVSELLDDCAVVRPQNYFSSLPWHARWDTSRSLINRAFGSDYPGTLGVRKSVLVSTRGYRSDVLFENLELIRTVRASGGIECKANNLFVARTPPTARKFLSQRVRQAYDGFAQPHRLALELLVLPTLLASFAVPLFTLGFMFLVVVLAEVGRRRSGGRGVFPPSSAFWAPLWLFERAVCAWTALILRARGGVPYAGKRIYSAGSSMRLLTASAGTEN